MSLTIFSLALLGLLALLPDDAQSNPLYSSPVRQKRAPAPCGKTIEMDEDKTSKITKLKHGKDVKCTWIIVGTEKCHPKITCPKVDVQKDGEDGLVISDAIGGEVKLTGSAGFTRPKIASGGARDLFVEYTSKAAGKGIECQIACGKDGDALPLNGEPKKEEFKCVCGLQNKDDRIVGGEDAKMNEFPWQVALVKPGTRQPMCGASVINNKFILTAAHCFFFEKKTEDELEVLIHAQLLDFAIVSANASLTKKLGEYGSMQARGYDMAKKTDADEKSQRYKVKKIIMHDLFTAEYDYDIALLLLDKKIDLTLDTSPTPICLPKAGDYKQTWDGKKATVSGWGLGDKDAGATTRLLQKLEVPVIPLQKCRDMMPQDLTQRMLCAGYAEGGKDACQGDSGGPLTVKGDNKQWTQIGIVSWGEECALKNRPGLYSRLTELTQWINYHTKGSDVKWCRTNK